ncbi:MAG: outer membrane protein assembly factor BamD [Gammaproteobacteria bacterium]|nr:outer membrane protein assembly factor BamD [Gammaproteobacteria bacterium]
MSRQLRIGFLLLVFGASGCAWMPFIGSDKEETEAYTTEEILYNSARNSMRSGNYNAAIEKLERLEARFPFGRHAEQAQLELIYARLMAHSLDDAESAADRFLRLHPQNPNIDYVLYLQGLISERFDRNLFDRFRPGDLAKRDVTNARQAFAHYSDLLRNYPDSIYAKDARQRMIHLRNLIATSEINIAMYYMSRGAYVAAANRARGVVENYSQTPAASDALAILVEASYQLGLPETANDALRILALNYPEHSAFDIDGNFAFAQATRQRTRSLLNVMTFGLIGRSGVPEPASFEQPRN